MSDDIVRVLRIVEYVGPRGTVESELFRSIHGAKEFPITVQGITSRVTIRATTLGEFPEIVEPAKTWNDDTLPPTADNVLVRLTNGEVAIGYCLVDAHTNKIEWEVYGTGNLEVTVVEWRPIPK